MGSEVNIRSHLVRMRATTIVALAVALVAAIAVFVLPHRESAVASPLAVSLVAGVACLWIGFSANRDAAARLEKIRRAFAVHGDERGLLRDHWMVYLVVVIRLEMMVVGGYVVGIWGLGPKTAVWLIFLGGLMIALTWPTRRKSQLLLGRARSLREDP